MNLELIAILGILVVMALWAVMFSITSARAARVQRETDARLSALERESHSHAFFGSKPTGLPGQDGPVIPAWQPIDVDAENERFVRDQALTTPTLPTTLLGR